METSASLVKLALDILVRRHHQLARYQQARQHQLGVEMQMTTANALVIDEFFDIDNLLAHPNLAFFVCYENGKSRKKLRILKARFMISFKLESMFMCYMF